MSFTIQSASLPVVETCSRAVTSPASTTSSASGAVAHVSTSGRSFTNRWSSVSHAGQPDPLGKYVGSMGRLRYGTGCAGSETKLSLPVVLGASKESLPSPWK